MKSILAITCGLMIVCSATSSPAAGKAILGGIQLLDGYTHQPLQGIDSVVGRITKEGGLQITYEIGSLPRPGGLRLGGQFSDRPRQMPKEQLQWYREQTINGEPVHLAWTKTNQLMVSYPKRGMNLSAKVTTAEEMADALLMILTIPNPPAKPAADGVQP